MLLRQFTRSRLQLGRPHVIGWRVGEIAAKRDAIDDAAEVFAIHAIRYHQVQLARLRLAVACELIPSERECEGRQP